VRLPSTPGAVLLLHRHWAQLLLLLLCYRITH
jgi:hypothetical protein